MEFFRTNTTIDFMGQRKWAAIFSALLLIFSVFALATHGLNLGLDFTGGTQVVVKYNQGADTVEIRKQLTEVGFVQAKVQSYGSINDVMIRIGPQKEVSDKALRQKLVKALPGGEIQQVEFIGPQVGKALVTNGILAVLVSLIATMLYIAMRFEYRFAVSGAVALIHDPVLILGVFSFFGIEFNLISLAALLTIIGYSLNDTVVIYDRVRENFRKIRKGSVIEIMNNSINQTLSRTIMTSGLTLIVVVALFLFGGETLRGFSLALIIGILVGTYSSIYVAGSLAVAIGLERKHLLPATKEVVDDMP